MLKRRKVLRGLQKLNGQSSAGGKHEKYKVVLDGKTIGSFAIPSTDDYSDQLIQFVSRKLGLRNRDFCEICECHKGLDWYRDHLETSGML